MNNKSFLRSVIADARPRQPLFESWNSPAPPDGTKPQAAPADGDIFHSEPAADMSADISPATNRLSRMDAPSRLEGAGATLADYERVAFHPTDHDAVNDSLAKSRKETGMIYDPALDTNDGPQANGALSVNRSDEEGGNPQGPETALPLNEMTRPDADAWLEMDSNPEKSRPTDGHHEPESKPAISLGPIENSADAGWDPSERDSEPAGEVLGTRPSGAVLSQSETKVQYAAEAEKPGPKNANGRELADGLPQGAGRDVISPVALEDPEKPDRNVTVAEMSGPVSAPAELPRRASPPKTIDNRQYPASMAIERDRPEPVAKSAHQASRTHHQSTAAAPVLPATVSHGSSAQGQAAAGNIAVGKTAAALDSPVYDIMTNDMDSDPLSQSSVKEVGPEKALAKVAAQTQPTSVQTRVLHGNPISHNNVIHAAKTAYGTSVDASKVPEVKIGQVDVFIEAAHRSDKRGTSSSPPPSLSLSSRHYLRRL